MAKSDSPQSFCAFPSHLADDLGFAHEKDLALYVHVPFCVSRCNYCDFCSSTDLGLIDAYFEQLDVLIRSYGENDAGPCSVSSVYFGGGTPSLSHKHLIAALDAISETFSLADDCEITLEANPESFDEHVAQDLAAAGFTRVSLGIQSFDDRTLRILGRAHTCETAFKSLQSANDAGLRVSADLMMGLPGAVFPGAEQWSKLLSLVDHVSVYPLTVEEGTQLEQMLDAGTVALPREEELVEQVIEVQKLLAGYGFERYEISSFARPGQESRQNMRYWLGGPEGDYLGMGVSAASMINHADGSRTRYVVHETLEDFFAGLCDGKNVSGELEELTPEEARREDIMLALRTRTGVSAAQVEDVGLTALLDELVGKDLLETYDVAEDVYYHCTQQGWLLANIVFSAVWLAQS